MGKPNLSLCMIVKNEEDFIDKCLSSVKEVVDEIIIVDTGSTDQTIDICRSHGATIDKFKWNGSFADARNYGLNKATGDWILWLDADEEVDPADLHKLKEASYFEKYDVLSIHLVNYYGASVNKDQSTDVGHIRLFRRSTGLKYINKIHECLNIAELESTRMGHLNVKVHHYGYLDHVVEKKRKFERNIKMLKKQLKEKENVLWAQYYLAMEYYRNKEYNEAFERVNLSIRAFLSEGILPPSMVYKLKYSILISLGSFEGAWPSIEKAIILYPDYVDLHFFKGLILFSLKKYDMALQSFEKCLEIGENNINYLILRGVGSFQAMHYKGLCEEKLGNNKKAILSYLQALVLSPQYTHAYDSLIKAQEQSKITFMDVLKDNFKGEDYVALKSLLAKN